MGVVFVAFRRQLASASVEMNYRFLGLRVTPRPLEIAFLGGGVLLVVIGILNYMGVTR
jgi:hypothetical protein